MLGQHFSQVFHFFLGDEGTLFDDGQNLGHTLHFRLVLVGLCRFDTTAFQYGNFQVAPLHLEGRQVSPLLP